MNKYFDTVKSLTITFVLIILYKMKTTAAYNYEANKRSSIISNQYDE
jgi:hypothetical protein